jgi:predicted DNA-binding transcriptional regulator AlpA
MDATLESIRRQLRAQGDYVRERDLLPFSRSTLVRKVGRGEFPKPVTFGPAIRAWRSEDIIAWFAKF